MRRVAYALIASGALMLGALTSALAGCYGGDCYDGGYRPYYSERPVYRSYYGDCGGGDCGYYGGGARYHTVYYERPSYGYYDDYNDGSVPYYRNSCDYGYGCGGGYYRTSAYSDCAYGGCSGGYYRSAYYGGGCGYSGCGYRRYYGGCGSYGCGYGYRRYYGGCGYGYGYGYGCGYPVARYGGAWMQTGPAYASWGGGYYGGGWGGGYYGGGWGCRTTYIPYGWTWYRASSC